ncbi:MAG: hypothetical protein JO006_07385 [Paucibacter sp.]|nr:hypothetical protein [Roseateles sp.]
MIYTTAPNDPSARELRAHERVELAPSALEPRQIPLWVFTSPSEMDASSGLVMNLSHSGLQVMTGPGQLKEEHYEVRLMLDNEASKGTDSEFSGPIRRVWSREVTNRDFGDSELSGFEFEHPDSPAEQFLRRRADGDQDGLVRCVLVARKMIGAFAG